MGVSGGGKPGNKTLHTVAHKIYMAAAGSKYPPIQCEQIKMLERIMLLKSWAINQENLYCDNPSIFNIINVNINPRQTTRNL